MLLLTLGFTTYNFDLRDGLRIMKKRKKFPGKSKELQTSLFLTRRLTAYCMLLMRLFSKPDNQASALVSK